MKRINRLKNCIQNEGRVLSRDTGSLLAAAWRALGLFAVALLLPQLGLRLGPAWLARLSDLVGTLALTPVFVALALTVLAAAWRRQRCAPAEAVKGLREKLWRVLVTGLCNVQTIRTCDMANLEVVIFVRGKRPSEDMVELADENDMVLICTPYSMFKTCGILYEAGMKPLF